MTESLEAPRNSVVEKRPRVRLDELPKGRGWAIGFMCLVIGLMGVFALVAGGLKATGNLEKPDTEAVWLAHQSDILDQTYNEYVHEVEEQNALAGTLMMVIFAPAAIVVAGALAWGTVSEVTKCQKGHVTYKSHSYCPECGEKVYTQNELPPEEWAKRYGA